MWVRTAAWRRYQTRMIRSRYPWYASRNGNSATVGERWHENDCIFSALAQYLLAQFGLLVPQDSLFKVFNQGGEGILPGQIIEAVRAVVEPLGFEVWKVLAPDQELRGGLGYPEVVVDHAGEAVFDHQPGLCMINITDGYSHAFYWKEMARAKFYKEQFRMAVMVRPLEPLPPGFPSAIRCLDEYAGILRAFLAEYRATMPIQADLGCLVELIHHPTQRQEPAFRLQVDQGLSGLLGRFDQVMKMAAEPERYGEIVFLEETGQMIRRIFQECEMIG